MVPIIQLTNIAKSYKLFDSPLEKAVYGLGLESWGKYLPNVRPKVPEHLALRDVSLEVKKGGQLGIIGRNGGGKSTLLKIITGVIMPTSGERKVSEKIEALFDTSTGLNPELTGMENIYNGLRLRLGKNTHLIEEATQDIIDFVELGDYLQQPVKAYSQGMAARFAFALATAVRPDVVVVDEILGAGDAYFSAKAARRMRSMLGGQTTLVLVTHSTKQVLQFCDRTLWLENGKVVMQGESLQVIKAYEEFIEHLRHQSLLTPPGRSVLQNNDFCQEVLEKTLAAFSQRSTDVSQGDSIVHKYTDVTASIESNVVGKTGLSRWPNKKAGVLVRRVLLTDADDKPTVVIETGHSFYIHIDYEATSENSLKCCFIILFFTAQGDWLSRQVSQPETIEGKPGEIFRKTLYFPVNYLGTGDIVFTVALFETEGKIIAEDNLETLSRSFEFKVINAEKDDKSLFCHPCEWQNSYLCDTPATREPSVENKAQGA